MDATTSRPALFDRYPALDRLDRRLTGAMRRWGPDIARVSLAIVFLWFGLLKVFGVTPVGELVAATMPWVPSAWLVPVLGVFETLLGLALLFKVFLRTALGLLWLQLLGTFAVLVLLPHVAFQGGNPLLLTVEGEFVVKNLVLIAAGIVIGGTLRRARREASLLVARSG